MKPRANFTGIMPYTNDFFTVSQPLLRWKSRIIGNRFDKLRNALYPNLAEQERSSQRALLEVQLDRATRAELATATGRQALSINDLEPVASVSELQPHLAPTIDCGIARLLQRDIGSNPPPDWRRLITTESMAALLERLRSIVAEANELQNFPEIANYVETFTHAIGGSDRSQLVQLLFDKEARVSGFLLFLSRHKPTQLNELFFTAPQADNLPAT